MTIAITEATSQRRLTGNIAQTISRLAVITIALLALSSATSAATCNRACLLKQAKQFNANMIAHTSEKIPLAPNAQIRENTKAIALADSKWSTVTQILSEGVYADVIKGNVIEHVAAKTSGGKTVYIGTRLKLVDRKIKEVEINFDDGPMVNPKNLIPYDPFFTTIVPIEQRSTRKQLERIITSYFTGLNDHKPIEADYDARCDRYHSGTRVTHNPRSGIEESGDVGCYESNLGPKPWGPATEVRIALIDPERGIVIAYCILHYANSNRRMQINEVFKIIDGRIRLIDNIGLMAEGIKTSGFTH
mgnify:CR=1 FL=1